MKHIILNLNLNLEQDGFQKAKNKYEQNCYLKNKKIILEIYPLALNLNYSQECRLHNDTDSTYHKHSELSEEQNIQKVLYRKEIVKPLVSSHLNHILKVYPQCNCSLCTNEKHLEYRFSQDNYKDTQCLCHSKDLKAQQCVCRKYENNYQCSYGDIITINLNMQGF